MLPFLIFTLNVCKFDVKVRVAEITCCFGQENLSSKLTALVSRHTQAEKIYVFSLSLSLFLSHVPAPYIHLAWQSLAEGRKGETERENVDGRNVGQQSKSRCRWSGNGHAASSPTQVEIVPVEEREEEQIYQLS